MGRSFINPDDVHDELLSVLNTLFKECNYIAEIYIHIPNADYHGILKTLEEHEDLFRSERVSWQIKHLDLGFELRFDKTNRNLERKVI